MLPYLHYEADRDYPDDPPSPNGFFDVGVGGYLGLSAAIYRVGRGVETGLVSIFSAGVFA